jgi:hypothetical protein
MKIINLTPHTINETTTSSEYKASGIVARLNSQVKAVKEVNGIPIYSKQFGEVENLPAPVKGTYYIVSGLMLDHAKRMGRVDLLAPGELVRNEQGQPVGCKGFVM